MTIEAKKATKMEKKLKVLLGGYQVYWTVCSNFNNWLSQSQYIIVKVPSSYQAASGVVRAD